jgi:phosphoesterase RecJ-like protein
MFQEIVERIRKYDTIIIHRHHRPDGDAMGSQLGMKHLILGNFPEKTVYVVGDTSAYLSFMDGATMDEIPDSAYDGALAMILDSASPSMVCDDRYKLAAATVRMDHHLYCETFTDIEVIDTSYESCCGLITAFAVECGLHINKAAATAL